MLKKKKKKRLQRVQHDKSQTKKCNRKVMIVLQLRTNIYFVLFFWYYDVSAKISSRVCVTHVQYLMFEASTQLPICVVYEVTNRQDHLEIKVGWFYGA
jgi:hypothetical protein